MADPALERSKLLHGAVDAAIETGWFLKSLQLKTRSLANISSFQFVIQRADIVKKAVQLGFPNWTEESSSAELQQFLNKSTTRKGSQEEAPSWF